eukprot:3181910-Rhodomonas_salina.2
MHALLFFPLVLLFKPPFSTSRFLRMRLRDDSMEQVSAMKEMPGNKGRVRTSYLPMPLLSHVRYWLWLYGSPMPSPLLTERMAVQLLTPEDVALG